jgi:hypothetical protein
MKKELKGLEQPKTVVHCDTEEKANQVLKIATEAGYDGFSDGVKYSEDNKYERYKENTCYQIKQGWYSGLNFYTSEGYKIITAEEFIKANPTVKLPSKEDVYVVLDTPEKVRQFYSVLVQANEPIYYTSKERWSKGEVDSEYDYSKYSGGEWNGLGIKSGTEVSVEQLAEILNVKVVETNYRFKVGDRVSTAHGIGTIVAITDHQSQKYIVANDQTFLQGHNCYSNSNIIDGSKDGLNSNGWFYKENEMELVKTETQTKSSEKTQTIIPNRKVSREALAVIYPQVCSGWQANITSLLAKTSAFSNEVEVSEDMVKTAYNEANDTQRKWLNLHLPAPKKIETVEVVKWAVLDLEDLIIGSYATEKLARGAAGGNTVVELKGSYTVEVEDEEYSFELPF